MIYVLISIFIFVSDFLIKSKVEKTFAENQRKEICKGRIVLQNVQNKGAMMNLMDKKQEFVAGLSTGIAISILLGFIHLLTRPGKRMLKLAAAMILGGGCSNIYDRIKRKYVVDYVSFKTKWKRFNQIVYNISDFFIFIGSFLFILWNSRHKS